MKQILTFLLLLFNLPIFGQISGVVVDALTEEGIANVSIVYEGLSDVACSDNNGLFSINRHNSHRIKVSAVGYKPSYVRVGTKTPGFIRVSLSPDIQELSEVNIVGKRTKYTRKNNPAIELMKRVIDKKKTNDIIFTPTYQYDSYKKVVLIANDITEQDIINEKNSGKQSWYIDHVEYNSLTNKCVLPLQMEESVVRYTNREGKSTESMLGHKSSGVANFSETASEFMNQVVGDVSADIDIYKDEIRILQQKFVSPISNSALSIYRFYIADTLYIDNDRCIQVYFTPGNQQDFGFNGTLYICNDSSLHVKKAELSLPYKTGVNHISSITLKEEYVRVNNTLWGLSTDDMYLELNVLDIVKNAAIIRSTKHSNICLGNIAIMPLFSRENVNKETTDSTFWAEYRTIQLSNSEMNLTNFAESIHNRKGLKYLFYAMRYLIDDYVSFTNNNSYSSKIEFGPVKSVVSSNPIDGVRFLLGGRTTAVLSGHSFIQGYVAKGLRNNKWYYSAKYTYSFEKIDKEPWEYPMNQISISSDFDIISPSQKFQEIDKNSVFSSFTVKPLKYFYWYNRQKVDYTKEINKRLSFKIGAKFETVQPALLNNENDGLRFVTPEGNFVDQVRTTELATSLRYAIGEKYLINKTGRYSINQDVTIFGLSHSYAIPHFCGGEYLSNMSEFSVLHRLWLKSFGYADIFVKGSIQWNKVPFPLLIMPKTNLSWIAQHNAHTFMLMDDMEFLTDREFMWDISWSANGKIFNRIPLLKKLKLREYIGFKGMLGRLTDKNNPYINKEDNNLFLFPTNTSIIGMNPYMEFVFGISNIFKFLEVDYVRRLSYTKEIKSLNGIRFAVNINF